MLILIDSLLPGGAEKSLLLCVPVLRNLGVEPVLVCLKQRVPNLGLLAKELNVIPIYLDSGVSEDGSAWYFGLPRWTIELRRLIHREKPDLVHATLFQACLVSRLAAAGLGIPVLNSLVNLDYDPRRLVDPSVSRRQYLSKLKLGLLRALNRATVPLVSHFHAVTPAVAQAAQRDLKVPSTKISVVYRGRNFDFHGKNKRQALCDELALPRNSRFILNVGRQDFQKGQWALIEAMAGVLKVVPNAILLLAGREGTMTARLAALVQDFGLDEYVRFLGHRDDVPDLLASCEVFCLPSVYEGAAGAILEAMAAACPIAATDLPEFDGLITDRRDCLLSPPNDSEGLARNIVDVLNREELADTLRRNARARFEQAFTLEKSCDGLVSLYTALTTAS